MYVMEVVLLGSAIRDRTGSVGIIADFERTGIMVDL
jgi:hypothetical protein